MQNQNIVTRIGDWVFWAGQKGKGKVGLVIGKPKFSYVVQPKKEDKDKKKVGKQKCFASTVRQHIILLKVVQSLLQKRLKRKRLVWLSQMPLLLL